MKTLKEKLNHGDLDHALTRDEVNKILEMIEADNSNDKLDEAYDEGKDAGLDEGREEGKEEGAESEFERLKALYKEAVEECAPWLVSGGGASLKKKLDEIFEAEG
jgi:flagellar biosynthesis/type III secretory pathway protein FliH